MSMVDLPTPGSPPIRTTLPGTMPPPSTRLSSAQASGVRAEASVGISLSRTTRAAARGLDFDSLVAFRTWNSCSVFQARQCGHWPAQRRLSPPHEEQTKVVVALGIRWSVAGRAPIYKQGRKRCAALGVVRAARVWPGEGFGRTSDPSAGLTEE